MTRDEILSMKPGRELDELVAEKVFKWRKVHGPKTDYDGPCESFDVLIPPTIDDPFPLYPPKGAIKPWWFCRNWSTDISTAFEVWEHDRSEDWRMTLLYANGKYLAMIVEVDREHGHKTIAQVEAESAAEAMVKCRLLAELAVMSE